MQQVSATTAHLWNSAAGYQRLFYVVGMLLTVAGLVHAVVYLFDPQPWAGPLGWRKPIEFGVSLGITGLFMGWIMTWLPRRGALGWPIAVVYGIAAVVEYSAITLQAWRGVPSHFNEATSFDGAVFSTMGAAILTIVIAIVALMLWTLASMRRPPRMALAASVGLGLLLVGQGLGLMIIFNGNDVVDPFVLDTFSRASVYGEGGDMRLPHAAALHGIQVLPLLAWLLGYNAWTEGRRVLVVAAAALGYTAIVGAAVRQMLLERPLSDPDALNLALAVLGALAIAGAYAVAVATLARPITTEREFATRGLE